MQITCPNCRESTLAGRYCDHCGAQLEKICRSCSVANRPTARFCTSCGSAFETQGSKPVPAVGPDVSGPQQKQVTIVFADICGSTELISQMDAEDASQILGAVIDVIVESMSRFGGVVNRQMGDGVMVLFGAPIATEDHAARACFGALAALEAVGRMGDAALPLRIGMCSGPVILRRTGRDDEDYDVAGVTAHIAARLEQRAEPGTVLLANQTARLVSGIATLETVGRMVLRGLAEPLEVFRLLSAIDRPSWILRSGVRALSTFVGREDELVQLSHAFASAQKRHAQAVALVADAGMGKSRLLHEFLGTLPHGTWHVIRVETTAQSVAVPYFLVTALLREFVGCSQEDSAADIAARLPSAIASLGPDIEVDLTPLLVHLDRDVDEVGFDTILPAERRRRLIHALRPLLLRYADLHPLVLLIEDYHWLDMSSTQLLNELLHGLGASRLVLLMTTRPERRPGWHGPNGHDAGPGAVNAREIELKHLTPKQADDLLQELIGSGDELAPLRSHIIERTNGTPFFLEEFARSLHESGALAYGVPSLANIVIPASVQSILAARIDRLSPLQRRILQIAAVIGRDVPSSLLAAVADMNEAALTREIDGLCLARFLVEDGVSGGMVHSFSHALTQVVAYDTLLRSDRRVLHERVLRALETHHRDTTVDHLAHHAVHAEAWQEAARYSLAAGERANRRSAPTEAKAYLETAIAALGRLPPSVETVTMGIDARLSLRALFTRLNDSSGMQEHMQEYLKEAHALAEQAGDRLNLARVYISRSAMLSHWGDLPGAIELSRTALDIMIANEDSVGVVSAAFTLAQAQWYSGDLEDARDVLVSNIAYARSDSGQRRSPATFILPAAAFFAYLARVQMDLGDTEAAFVAIREAHAVTEQYGHAFDQVLINGYHAALLLATEQIATAIDLLESTLSIARANKIEWHIALIGCVLGEAYVETGRYVEARQLLESACEFADRNRHIGRRLLCGPPLVRALAEAPDPDLPAAEDLAMRTLHEATARGFRQIVVQTKMALARVMTLAGDPERAASELREAVALARRIGLRREEMAARDRLSALLRHDGTPLACEQ